jgi:hypothetical protein
MTVHLFQIAYDTASLAQVNSSGFELLDNLQNERPDWYEYWAIRRYLVSHTLSDGDFYGFFSPKFTAKTQLTCEQVVAFVTTASANRDVDVALFSPQPDMGSNFLNVFEQAELFDPGFNATARQFLISRGLQLPLESLVMDSRQVVFSNYFVARPAFWRLWFEWTEAIFSMAEDAAHPLHAELTHQTGYATNAQRKVFLVERVASLLMYLQPQFKVAVANSFDFGWSMSKFRERPTDAYISDALKMAYRETGFPQYMDAFRKVRESFK